MFRFYCAIMGFCVKWHFEVSGTNGNIPIPLTHERHKGFFNNAKGIRWLCIEKGWIQHDNHNTMKTWVKKTRTVVLNVTRVDWKYWNSDQQNQKKEKFIQSMQNFANYVKQSFVMILKLHFIKKDTRKGYQFPFFYN